MTPIDKAHILISTGQVTQREKGTPPKICSPGSETSQAGTSGLQNNPESQRTQEFTRFIGKSRANHLSSFTWKLEVMVPSSVTVEMRAGICPAFNM